MEKRISKEALVIANKYIAAKESREFDELPAGTTPSQLLQLVKDGKVFEELLHEIEFRFVNMTSLVYAGIGLGITEAYKRQIRKAFKLLLDK